MNKFIFAILLIASIELSSNEKISGIYINRYAASSSKFYTLVRQMTENNMNAAIIDIKYDRGEVGVVLSDSFSVLGSYDKINDIKQKVDTLKSLGIRTIARVVCFKDGYLGKYDNHKYAVKYTDGSIFKDAAGFLWVSPYSKFVRAYIIEVSKEAAKMGFDEIQFDYIRYPTDGVKGQLSFPEYNGMNGFEVIVDFLKEACEELKTYNVDISVDVYGYTVWFDSLYYVMQQLEGMAQYSDAVYPMVYPSHFSDSLYNKRSREQRTYDIIYESGIKTVKRIKKYESKTILYLQDFTWKSSRMGADYINNQIKAAIDADVDGYILWNPSSDYYYFDLAKRVNFINNNSNDSFFINSEEPIVR